MPSLVVTEQWFRQPTSVRQELAENSVTSSVAGSYFEIRTTHAPHPPARSNVTSSQPVPHPHAWPSPHVAAWPCPSAAADLAEARPPPPRRAGAPPRTSPSPLPPPHRAHPPPPHRAHPPPSPCPSVGPPPRAHHRCGPPPPIKRRRLPGVSKIEPTTRCAPAPVDGGARMVEMAPARGAAATLPLAAEGRPPTSTPPPLHSCEGAAERRRRVLLASWRSSPTGAGEGAATGHTPAGMGRGGGGAGGELRRPGRRSAAAAWPEKRAAAAWEARSGRDWEDDLSFF
nr:formin-like protein 20 [Lolium perenne]